MNLSVAIQSHPKRADMAAALALEVGGTVVYDPEPDKRGAAWRSYRACLEQTPPEATHRLIIQDDGTACPYFREAAEKAIVARPDRVLVFFVAGRPVEHSRAVYAACDRDEVWAELDNDRWCPAIAVCWPVDLIPPFLRFVDFNRWPESFSADDEIIGRFLKHRDIRPLATVPSLIEHTDTVPSLLGKKQANGNDYGRVAACWIGACADCGDARDIDWT